MISYLREQNVEKSNAIIINGNYYQGYIDRLSGYKRVDFNSFIQKALYHSVNRVAARRFSQKNSDHFFIENNLRKSRTALLSPYAVTASGFSFDIWEHIVGNLKEVGYDICTNVVGEDRAINGTIGIELPYEYILDFVDKAGLFIGLRSGLCDIISGTYAEMVVLYPDKPASAVGSFFDFFSLVNMGIRKERIKEYIVDKGMPDGFLLKNQQGC